MSNFFSVQSQRQFALVFMQMMTLVKSVSCITHWLVLVFMQTMTLAKSASCITHWLVLVCMQTMIKSAINFESWHWGVCVCLSWTFYHLVQSFTSGILFLHRLMSDFLAQFLIGSVSRTGEKSTVLCWVCRDLNPNQKIESLTTWSVCNKNHSRNSFLWMTPSLVCDTKLDF